MAALGYSRWTEQLEALAVKAGCLCAEPEA